MAELAKAFTAETLSAISRQLIGAYRNRQYDVLSSAARSIAATEPDLHRQTPSRLFAGLLKIYHPDRSAYYRDRLALLARQPDEREFQRLSVLAGIRLPDSEDFEQEVDDEAFYTSDEDPFADHGSVFYEEDFDEVRETENLSEEDEFAPVDVDEALRPQTFLDVLSLEEPGLRKVPLDFGILSTLEGPLDLSAYEMEDLSGIDRCAVLRSLNLSGNRLTDIRDLRALTLLEELNLAENQIQDIAPLRYLERLRDLDLAFNDVDDIEALFDLPHLEFVNLIGNPVSLDQVRQLRQRGVLVVSDYPDT